MSTPSRFGGGFKKCGDEMNSWGTVAKSSYSLYLGVLFCCFAIGLSLPAVAQEKRLFDTVYEDPISGKVIGVDMPLSAVEERYRQRSSKSRRRIAGALSAEPEQLADAALQSKRSQLGLKDPVTQLRRKHVERDELGVVHVEYEQVFKGVPLFGSKIAVHINPGSQGLFINGRVSEKDLDDVSPQISPEQALKIAEDAWQKEVSSQPAIFKGGPALLVLDTGLLEELSSGAIYLAYQVDLGRAERSVRYFVDAKRGEVLYKLPLSTDATKRWVFDCSYGDGDCYLGIYSAFWGYVFGREEGQASVGSNPLFSPLIQAYPNETDRLYSQLGSAHGYYLNTHRRNGANGVGGLGNGVAYPKNTIPAASYADFMVPGMGCPNAAFNPMFSRLAFCTGLMLIDTVGHEFTHAVIFYTANLMYQGESGALNESLADIFGEAIERYGIGSHDWLLGTTSRIGTLRSMQDPTAQFYNPYVGAYSNGGHPDRFHSPLYQCGAGDSGGVHSNSGVFNHAAYLIAVGGSFNGCSISGIGEDKMESIMYRALTRYLSSTSRFADAYLSVRTAASDLYSEEDALQVEKALRAVELNQAGYCSGMAAVDTGCAGLVDECPGVADQIVAGVCGCGVSSADKNKNGQADCLDPKAATVPSLATAEVMGTKVRLGFQNVPKATYEVTLTLKGGKAKKVISKKSTYTAKLSKGSWTVSYRISLGRITSKSSKALKITVS